MLEQVICSLSETQIWLAPYILFMYLFIYLCKIWQPYTSSLGVGPGNMYSLKLTPNSRETQIYNHLYGTLIELFRGKRKRDSRPPSLKIQVCEVWVNISLTCLIIRIFQECSVKLQIPSHPPWEILTFWLAFSGRKWERGRRRQQMISAFFFFFSTPRYLLKYHL